MQTGHEQTFSVGDRVRLVDYYRPGTVLGIDRRLNLIFVEWDVSEGKYVGCYYENELRAVAPLEELARCADE